MRTQCQKKAKIASHQLHREAFLCSHLEPQVLLFSDRDVVGQSTLPSCQSPRTLQQDAQGAHTSPHPRSPKASSSAFLQDKLRSFPHLFHIYLFLFKTHVSLMS